MNKPGKTLFVIISVVTLSGIILWAKYRNQPLIDQPLGETIIHEDTLLITPDEISPLNPGEPSDPEVIPVKQRPRPKVYKLEQPAALIAMLEKNPQVLERLGYQAVRSIELYCEESYRARDSFDPAPTTMVATEAWLREKKYSTCMRIPDWYALKESADRLSEDDTSELYISEQLTRIAKDKGAEYARKVAENIWKTSKSPLAVLNAGDFLGGTDGFMRPEKDFLRQVGVAASRANELEWSARLIRFCLMGGDCSPTSNIALNAICIGNPNACGLDVMTAIQDYWLSPVEFSALEQWYLALLAN